MELQLTGGPGAGRRIAVSQERTAVTGRWVVGRDPGCHLVLADLDVSRRHVEIDLTRATVRDLGSTNGTGFAALDGTPLRPVGGHPEPWPDGAHLALGSCRLALRAARGGPRAAVHPDGAGHVLVNRAPRLRPAGGAVTVDYPPSPAPPAPTRMPWATALLPLVVAVPMALIWHQPAFLAFAVLSPLAALTQYLIDRRSRRAQQAVTLDEYTRECAARDRDVAEHCAAQSLRRHADHPDLAALAADIVGDRRPGGRLWERRPGDDDQLWLRLGLADLPAELSVRRDGRTTVPVLGSVPLLLDLAAVRVLGIHGPRRAREALAHSLIGQLAGYCSPREVRLAVLTAGRDHRWQWIDRLPHAGPAAPGTGSVVLLDEADLLRRRPDVAALLAADDTLAICLAHSHEQLPQECAAVVRLGPDGDAAQGILHRRGHPPTTFVADLPDAGWAEQLAAALVDLRDATPEPAGAALPDAVPLLELVETSPAEIARGWLDGGDPTRLGAALGRTTGGVWSVDLVTDGPHVLVAGTTGAGKSELLTTLVSALATAHGPDRLAFLLVDYKGGTAFAHLAGVPHVTGVITDLDAALAHRALTSLRAELRRRERWLTGHAERPGSGLPRLVIVVDEFRVLAEEQPDLLAGLVRVATVGRGLGVHLVLATQRPAGVVSADIKANANLRIALRLRERADSDDVVDSPDASGLDPSRPGRAVVRRGGGDLVAVQVAHLCGVDRDRWLASVQAAARLIGARTPPAPWLPPLPDRLTDADRELVVAPRTGSPALPYALADLPEQQRRAVLRWDLTDDGHLAVVGGPGSGRSTVLRTLVAVAGRAGGIHVHVIDAGADLSDLADPARRPHVGTVVAAHDVERGTRLVAALTEEAQQRRRGAPAGAGSAPPLLLLVDGWESLVETWSRTDHGRGVEDLLRLARDGLSSGVRLAATGGRALLGGAVTATFSTRVLLPSADPHHAVLAGVPPARLPRHWPPGRILRLGRAGELIEAQVAQLDLDQGRPAGPGPTPLRLAPLPDHVELAPLLPAARRGIALIGVGGDEAQPEGLPSDDGPGALVCGPPGSGRSTALLTLAASLSHDGRSVLLVAPGHVGQVPGPGVVLRTGWDGPLPLEHDAVLLLDTGWASVPGLQECAVRHLAAGGTALRVVAAATAAEVAVAFRGLLADLRGLRTGLLLGSRSAADGDALGVRAPPSAGLPPGRGLLVSRGRARPVQVARDPLWSP